jgi:O-antigen/teichoic acid export membrane protein
LLKQQLGFIVPLGVASSLQRLHMYVGQVVVSAQLGVLALGIYSIASFKVPVVRIIRGAVSDAIFPDMVRQAASDQRDRLRLWKRGNVAYASLIIPIFMVLFWYADVLIPLVFTEKYADAVPIFRILLLLMPLEAIELNSPLRAANQTRFVMIGNLLMFGSNLLCIFVFFRWLPDFAILGPAVGVVFGALVERFYMAGRIMEFYSVDLPDMLKWRSLATVIVCTAMATLCLWAVEFIPLHELLRMPIAALAFAAVYYVTLRRCRLEEVETVASRIEQRLRRKLGKKG